MHVTGEGFGPLPFSFVYTYNKTEDIAMRTG